METQTILIVDDNEVDAHLLEGMLRDEGEYTFLRADSGATALELLQQHPDVALVLLDVYLPDVSGVEICRQLKSEPATATTSIILISGVHKDSASITAGLAAGADGYLTKPLHMNEVRAWVRAGLRLRALTHAHHGKSVSQAPSDTDLLQIFSKLSHAVNNPLQALMATADLLSLNLADRPQDEQYLTDIQRYADRIANMVAEASAKAALHLGSR